MSTLFDKKSSNWYIFITKEGNHMQEPSLLGKNIYAARVLKRLTQVELARQAKVSPSAITRIETGERQDIRVTIAARIAAALGLTVDELLREAVWTWTRRPL
jgi:DNA-binding XRE family transcriptional regulator